jgi:hypothetical protein
MNILRDKAELDDHWLFPSLLFLITIISRVPFTSKFLYHMDSVQYALALEKYDVTIDQPHAPGYFLYVMMGRFLNLLLDDANTVYISISIFFSGLTVLVLYYFCREMFDRRTAIVCALMAITSPNLWFHGELALNSQ